MIAGAFFLFGLGMFAAVMALGAHALYKAELTNDELRAKAQRDGNI